MSRRRRTLYDDMRALEVALWACIDAAAHALHPTFAPWRLIPTSLLDAVCDRYDEALRVDKDAE